jgi:hypothetical protein
MPTKPVPPSGPSWAVWLSAPILFLTRLPLLLRMQLALDGDEAVLGLMSLHTLEGQGLPWFFYGQGYGLSALEAATGALAFGLLDVSAWSLRMATLLLWSLGGALLVAAAGRMGTRAASWWALLLLVGCPAWLEWSGKARGGYVTAFLLFSLACWLAARARQRSGWLWLMVGLCCAGVLFAQALWLPGLLALVAAIWWERRAPDAAGWWLAGVLGGGVTLALVAGGSGYWSPDVAGDLRPLAALLNLPHRVYTMLHGAYLYEEPQFIGLASVVAGVLWTLGLTLLVAGVAASVARRRSTTLQQAGLVALLAAPVLSLVMSFSSYGYRYLLPISGALVLLLALEAGAARRTPAALLSRLAAAGLVLVGVVALAERAAQPLRDHGSGAYALNASAERMLVEELQRRGVSHAFSLDPLLPWNLAFSSREQVVARWFSREDRYPDYPRAVDSALAAGAPVALVGRVFQEEYLLERARQAGLPPPAVRSLGEGLFLVEQPDARLLRAAGFQMDRPATN